MRFRVLPMRSAQRLLISGNFADDRGVESACFKLPIAPLADMVLQFVNQDHHRQQAEAMTDWCAVTLAPDPPAAVGMALVKHYQSRPAQFFGDYIPCKHDEAMA